MTIAKLVLVGLIAFYSFIGCSRELTQSSQHGGSGTETVGIVGTVVDTGGRPVSGASVKLRRTDFLDTAQNALQKTKAPSRRRHNE